MRILFLDLDTLRADHLGCYGYHRDTSPNIDAMARQGVRFTNYFCSDAPCLPSRAALFSGQFGIHTGAVGHGGTAGDMRIEGSARGFRDLMAHQSLPSFLKRSGLRTVTVSPFAERHGAWWFYSGFNEMYNTGKGGLESAEEITPTVLKWISSNAYEDNWFLHVNYWDPHTPYRAPAEFGDPFEDDPLPEWLNQDLLDRHKDCVGGHGPYEINMFDDKTNPRRPRHPGRVRTMEELRMMVDGYDCGIRYMDGHIGRLFEALAEQGVLDDLVVIISADHGENLGELGLYAEHATADTITCRIPMIVRWPGNKPGHVDNGFHYNLDLAPTLSELLDRQPIDAWDGRSYAQAITEGKDCGRDYLVLSQCAHTCQRSVRFGPWLYMRTHHDFYHLWPEEMLYNVELDPHLQGDVAKANPQVCHEATYHYVNWHDRMMKTMPEGYDTDPMWTVMKEGGPAHSRGYLAKYCEFLEQTGRGWAIPELKRRHPREFE